MPARNITAYDLSLVTKPSVADFSFALGCQLSSRDVDFFRHRSGSIGIVYSEGVGDEFEPQAVTDVQRGGCN